MYPLKDLPGLIPGADDGSTRILGQVDKEATMVVSVVANLDVSPISETLREKTQQSTTPPTMIDSAVKAAKNNAAEKLQQFAHQNSVMSNPNLKAYYSPPPKKVESNSNTTLWFVIGCLVSCCAFLMLPYLRKDSSHKKPSQVDSGSIETEVQDVTPASSPSQPQGEASKPSQPKTRIIQEDREVPQKIVPTPPSIPVTNPQTSDNFSRISNARVGGLGRLITLGPLSFSSQTLANCDIKCSVPMTDDQGESILVIFFKEAYLSKLIGRTNHIFISGKLAKDGLSFYLSSIQ